MKKLTVYQILTLLLVIQILLVKFLSFFPNFIEQYYSNGIYQFVSKLFRKFLGWVPFSVGDIYYFLLGIVIVIGFYQFFKDKFKNLKLHIYKLGAFLSVFYFLFHFLWGMNYYRNSLFVTMDMPLQDYSEQDIKTVTEKLLNKLVNKQLKITENDSVKVIIPYNKNEILNRTKLGYDSLAKTYPNYTYKSVSIKKSLYSVPLTYMGFAGYLNPLSGEAQVDSLVPKVSLPMIASHEVAHQIGIASESEANFIGYLAAINNEDPYFNYSGYLTAFRYSVAALYAKDSIASKQLIEKIPRGILKNIEESQEFWRSYQNKMEPFFKLFYDGYLKANQQDQGLKSYSNMVYYLVAYDKKYGL